MSVYGGHKHKRRREPVPPQKEGGHTAQGEKATQPRRRETNNSATQKNEVGKQQHPKRKRGGKQHAPRRREKATPRRSKGRQLHPWASVALPLFSSGWWCFLQILLCVGAAVLPPSLGVVLHFLPWVVLVKKTNKRKEQTKIEQLLF